MKGTFSQKTWPLTGYPLLGKNPKQRGSFTILASFLFFIFSALGLSLLYATQFFSLTCSYRQNLYLLETAAENGAKRAFFSFAENLPEVPLLQEITEGEVDSLWSEMSKGDLSWLNSLYGIDFHAVETEEHGRMVWKSGMEGQTRENTSDDDCFAVETSLCFFGEGTIRFFPVSKTTSLEASLQILLGFVPLAAVPAILENINEENRTEVRIAAAENSLFSSHGPSRIKGLLPDSALPQLGRALKIRLLEPGDLSNSTLRDALGLEESNDPVPEAVYLIRDDLGLGGVFVQGDLDRMSLGLEGKSQVMTFTQDEREWNLRITPSELTTEFQTPEEEFIFAGLPRGVVFVDGSVLSLQEKEAATPMDWPPPLTPCLMNGIQLTIVSPEQIIISSNLLQQGLCWKNGIPYLKYSRSQLNLFACRGGEGDLQPDEGLITIDPYAPSDLYIQADVTAVGQGFKMSGTGRNLTILGGLHASTLDSPQNRIDIIPDERMDNSSLYWAETIRTKVPVLFTSSFKINAWREYPPVTQEVK
ncbi:MAG: hypothetical protein KJ727_10555 [Acidobacteria bacterium]|nr:hypothetical protein [Acidobacteriota bacterium]MBU4331052.1 hypothetical protein [Acidobacteriota bacterium]MBU4493973.1 hypothetical protein [Acidobacteriota bacterium]MCG2814897.1 hypothetical protein [Candidatus Aminicenantes bacterium]